MFAHNIINHAFFGNKVCTSYVEMLDFICPYKFSGGAVTDTAEHITELRQSHNIGIGSKKFLVVRS